MNSFWKLCLATILVQLLFLTVPVPLGAQQTRVSISDPALIKADFDSVPCKNEERLRAAKALFEKMGAPPSHISIQQYHNVENLVIRKLGGSQENIVIGAHYDKVSEGCGVIDNWTGIVTLAHLYKSLKDVPLKKTIIFVAFGKEEKGLVGSHAMAETMTKDQVSQYCEMINIDSFGLSAPQVADNLSSKKLGAFTAQLAKEMKVPFGHASIKDADADSRSFIAKNIPSVTVHGLTNDWPSILHTRNDQLSKVNFDSVYLGYRFVLALVVRLDDTACGEFR